VFRGGQRRRGWMRSEYVYGAEKRFEKKSRAECFVRCLVWWVQCVREGVMHGLFVLLSNTGRGLARFGPRAGPTGQRA